MSKPATIEIQTLIVGPLETNCHIVTHGTTNETILIDCAYDNDRIASQLEKLDSTPVAILLTHGHFDHIAEVQELSVKFSLPVYAHPDNDYLITHLAEQSDRFGHFPYTALRQYSPIQSGKLKLNGFEINVLHTPGHTPGSVCYLIDNVLFSGDTLFEGSVGRTDLEGGSMVQLTHSIQSVLYELPDITRVYPGHGPDTTIGKERLHNQVIRAIR